MPHFLALSLALPAVLFAANQAKRLLLREWDDWNSEKEHHHKVIESFILQTIYWLCLVLALILVILDFMAIFEQFPPNLWFTQALQTIYTHPEIFAVSLGFLALVIVILIRQQRTMFVWAELFTWFTWYTLLELPVKLIVDPAYRGLETLQKTSSHYRKTALYLTFYTLVYIMMAGLHVHLIWEKSSELNSWPSAGPIYMLFYIMAFVVNMIGTVFNWVFFELVGVLFVVESHKEETEEELQIRSVCRIYYSICVR